MERHIQEGENMDKGYIHIYTGNGKGKTTAALGLSVRAICAGKKVFFGQFVKGMDYSELDVVKYLPNIKIEQFGTNSFIIGKPSKADIDAAAQGIERCREVLKSGEYDVVVLDEINIALFFELFSVEQVLDMIKEKAENVELVMTGRYAPEKLIEAADLVTEMREIKHYYTQGVMARKGIES
jgi:cob(I)alamin adenosyltransferase